MKTPTKEEFNLSSKIEQFKKDLLETEKPFGKVYGEEKIRDMTDGALIAISHIKDLNKEAVRRLKAHFTPIDKQWMDVEMFSPREIIEFIDSKFGDKLTK